MKKIIREILEKFLKPEIVDKVTTIADNNYELYSKNIELERDMNKFLRIGTLIEIPESHYAGKNMKI